VTAKEWLRAQELLLPLRYGTFQGLKSKGLIERAEDAPVVLLDYDPQLGLLPREHISEAWIV